jgi:hypothetical protein
VESVGAVVSHKSARLRQSRAKNARLFDRQPPAAVCTACGVPCLNTITYAGEHGGQVVGLVTGYYCDEHREVAIAWANVARRRLSKLMGEMPPAPLLETHSSAEAVAEYVKLLDVELGRP